MLEYVEAVLDGSIVPDVAHFNERLNDAKASFVNLLRYKAPVSSPLSLSLVQEITMINIFNSYFEG